MYKEIEELLKGKPKEIQDLFAEIEEILKECMGKSIIESLWAKLPSYYVGENFVRLIPFKDHINIEAKAIETNASLFKNYKLTPKAMLQIYVNQDLPKEELKRVFCETLASNC